MASRKTIYDKNGKKVGTVEEYTTEDFVRGVETVGNIIKWITSPRTTSGSSSSLTSKLVYIILIIGGALLLLRFASYSSEHARPQISSGVAQKPLQTNNTTPNYLYIGGFGYITNNTPEVNMRSSPGYLDKPNNDVITKIPSGSVVKIASGPEQFDSLIWWYVSWEGHEGWIAEYNANGLLLLAPGIL